MIDRVRVRIRGSESLSSRTQGISVNNTVEKMVTYPRIVRPKATPQTGCWVGGGISHLFSFPMTELRYRYTAITRCATRTQHDTTATSRMTACTHY